MLTLPVTWSNTILRLRDTLPEESVFSLTEDTAATSQRRVYQGGSEFMT